MKIYLEMLKNVVGDHVVVKRAIFGTKGVIF